MLNTKSFIGCLVVVSVLLSCNKNESYDINGDTKVKFFTNNTSSGNAPQNSINYNVVNIPDVTGSGILNLSTTMPDTIKFPVFATRAIGQDVVIGAELDNSLIAEYNASHNTNYVAFPAGILKTDNLLARITKGSSTSADSIEIDADLTILNTLTEKTYMAPIRLSTVSAPEAGEIASNTSTQVTYIVANIELRRIKYLALAAEAQGALITPRSAWTTAFTPTPSIITGNILDGLTSTYIRWTETSGILDVNMQAAQNVTGIRLHTSTSSTYTPTQIEVHLSNDGINYDLIGSPLKANITYASAYSYILFYKAIPAKYVRLRLNYSTSTNSQNHRITEFDVYAN